MGELKNIRHPLVAVSIWAVFILPSVFFPEWCYLDDPANLWAGATLGQNPGMLMPDGDSGRFRPAYYPVFCDSP